MCAACRKMQPKNLLLRVAFTPEGEAVVDKTGKATCFYALRLRRRAKRSSIKQAKRPAEAFMSAAAKNALPRH